MYVSAYTICQFIVREKNHLKLRVDDDPRIEKILENETFVV